MTDAQLQRVADFYGITLDQGRANHAKVMSQGDNPAKPICIGCAKWPEEISEYREAAMDGPDAPEPSVEEIREFVIDQEGTFNPSNGHFLCTSCYIKNGSPTSSRGWVCP